MSRAASSDAGGGLWLPVNMRSCCAAASLNFFERRRKGSGCAYVDQYAGIVQRIVEGIALVHPSAPDPHHPDPTTIYMLRC